ncbi:MAG: alpha-hydroxy-acid oxidizing protein [Actinobacteria bacterium]|nr:alpha-hydroxy-acid oxidizing protein [Actinomycetota bacterium]
MLDLENLEHRAQERLSATMYAYFAGGADDETTLADNTAAWKRIRLLPRVMRDVSAVSIATEVLGTPLGMPILVGPWAFQGLAHPEGETATAKGAAAAGTAMVVSTVATTSLEDVAVAAPAAPRWFQFYLLRDRLMSEDLLHRAAAAGYRAVVMTVDKLPVPGRRRRLAADRFSLPERTVIPNFGYVVPEGKDTGPDGYLRGLLDPSVTFDDLSWACAECRLPLVVKGVLSPEDAVAAVEAGASGLIVSNHGGRQLDGAVATADALRAVVDAVAGRVPVLVDGGIRSGADVLKALAIGASAVLVTRPVIWGLVVHGAPGVEAVLHELAAELAHAMALCGARDVADVDRGIISGMSAAGACR